MNTSTLKTLLMEYDKKRMKAERQAQTEKNQLYEAYPELSKIDKELSFAAINTAKMMLQKPDEKLIEKLNKNIENLKERKIQILSSIGKTENDLLPHYECKKCKDTG